jgi:GNAT superfamily N-acetyltransferase
MLTLPGLPIHVARFPAAPLAVRSIFVRPMELIVRRGAARDAEEACRVVRRSIRECCAEDHGNDSAILDSWLRNKTPATVQSWFASEGYALVAERDDKIVGTAMLKADGTIVLFYVLPEARFAGIGRAMLQAIEAEARKRGLGRIELGSTKTAYGFYLRNGYADTGVEESTFGMSARRLRKIIDEKDAAQEEMPSR